MKTTTKQEKYRTHAMQNLRIQEITRQLKAGLTVYEASPLNMPTGRRRRADKAEMSERSAFLVAYARLFRPVTIRQLFYAATVHNVPGIKKDESGYVAVQRQCLDLRRTGEMSYKYVADGSRMHRKPSTHNGWEDALRETAETYRKALWHGHEHKVEIWIEKDALSGVVYPVTAEYDVSLMPTKGYTSETFAFNAVNSLEGTGKTLHAYCLYDFDRSGRDAFRSLEEKLHRFGGEKDVEVHLHNIALSFEQVVDMDLPTREPKRVNAADKAWEYDVACELDAIRPDILRNMVRDAIESHLPRRELEHLKSVEQMERQQIYEFVYGAGHA